MKTSIATVCIAGDMREKLAAIAAAGFDGIEIFEQDFIAFDASPREVGQMVRDHGLEITLFQPFRDFEGLPEPLRARSFERMERKFDLMQELGTDLVLVCSSVHPEALGGIDRMAGDFAELGARAAKRGLRVGFEALAWGKHVWDHRDAWEVVRRANHPNIGLILDSFHTLGRGIDPDSIRSIPSDKIFFVQLADAPLIEMDLLYWSRHFRNMPGEGDLDVTGFMRAVAATGYDGPISLEVFNDQFRGGSPGAIALDGHRSLVYLMDQVKRQEPGIAMSAPDMPPRVRADGVSFVEFAADEAEAASLGRLLRTMGFRCVGRHISKQVELWQQGEIRIVLNTEREGFAHSAHTVHGMNICDVGLRVDSAEATVQRAQALGASPFRQPVGPGEFEIPAIRGVGSGLLHFIDDKSDVAKVWDVEFSPVEDTGTTPDAGLTRIDHIAQTMNYEEMLTWSLFYLSLFETQKRATVDVVDPGGLVRSQAIESADGALRVTLNGAETHRTFAGRFIADSFGSSVQHVAFETDDIFATADALIANGFEPLHIPDNYYDDVAARLGVGDEMIVRLKAGNILYDEDGQGAYFQIYGRPFGDGIFFEIVQRSGGYAGYGAANAPFRIAAQRRSMSPNAVPRR
ncbi:sugar phosphate isomerase/epimerase and 4-hydroxyphenylpyruvate domain-containing protein [Pseudooceanicola sediminis]|uniref:3-dehydroshikimate dehydratase n=1 Tax=Pseudooceanicola sediminis TaxID=2211117 RepID=A0A399J0U5_9RHOB|nr:sugar phosphate isomerase/epimerase and 4-hydroxyphenylpyruvate domain-containing protein [Pseudooceanicola sediminis]KAA2316038.1 sugar phosphate isomerase/epimerase and 4-hydroxyphenylpyruvate domain-containing protein [Puniceibacterium sp. HSS470]RII38149.1 sugar phosphate isomerase/epimerase and 4-hydroxyphenylpyruvate domain-containing protein [Pseudooceanicola sediminis]|tara:strand:- start:18268 stop:20160 length:1893 start_codon:yes stop_codon:yes gene_type:complete